MPEWAAGRASTGSPRSWRSGLLLTRLELGLSRWAPVLTGTRADPVSAANRNQTAGAPGTNQAADAKSRASGAGLSSRPGGAPHVLWSAVSLQSPLDWAGKEQLVQPSREAGLGLLHGPRLPLPFSVAPWWAGALCHSRSQRALSRRAVHPPTVSCCLRPFRGRAQPRLAGPRTYFSVEMAPPGRPLLPRPGDACWRAEVHLLVVTCSACS